MVELQHLLWLYSPILERQDLLQSLQVKMLAWMLLGAECSFLLSPELAFLPSGLSPQFCFFDAGLHGGPPNDVV